MSGATIQLIQKNQIRRIYSAGPRRTAVTARRSAFLLLSLVILAAMGCEPRRVDLEVVDRERRAELVGLLQADGIEFTTDERGIIVCRGPSAKRCSEVYDRWQAQPSK